MIPSFFLGNYIQALETLCHSFKALKPGNFVLGNLLKEIEYSYKLKGKSSFSGKECIINFCVIDGNILTFLCLRRMF